MAYNFEQITNAQESNAFFRALRPLQSKDATVAKLFAKHIKIEEAKQFLERARTNIGVGTPQRIIDLLEAGEFTLNFFFFFLFSSSPSSGKIG